MSENNLLMLGKKRKYTKKKDIRQLELLDDEYDYSDIESDDYYTVKPKLSQFETFNNME